MKYLLDTHVAIWALEENPRLSEIARNIISDTTLSLCVSIVSAWEFAIKLSTGKLEYDGGSEWFLKELRDNNVEILDIKAEHIKKVETLPFVHRDPFDRLLIAASLAENMTILTADENIQKYDVLWAW